jgi:hypothetical protein
LKSFWLAALYWIALSAITLVVAGGLQWAVLQLPWWLAVVGLGLCLKPLLAWRMLHRGAGRGGCAGAVAGSGARAPELAGQPRCDATDRGASARKRHRKPGREPERFGGGPAVLVCCGRFAGCSAVPVCQHRRRHVGLPHRARWPSMGVGGQMGCQGRRRAQLAARPPDGAAAVARRAGRGLVAQRRPHAIAQRRLAHGGHGTEPGCAPGQAGCVHAQCAGARPATADVHAAVALAWRAVWGAGALLAAGALAWQGWLA